MGLTLARSLRYTPPEPIAFVGAGGKTTALFQLAQAIRQLSNKQPVLITATTNLGVWQFPFADRHIIAESGEFIEEIDKDTPGVVLITGPVRQDKATPISAEYIGALEVFCRTQAIPLMIEADGARQRPLKAPAEHEPPIPDFVKQVVYVAGLSGLGKPLNEPNVHRPEIFSRLSGLPIDSPITAEGLTRVLLDREGGLKGMPDDARRVLLFNQADDPQLADVSYGMSRKLLFAWDAVIIGSLNPTPDENLKSILDRSKMPSIHGVNEPVAGVILAAGGSSRFGQPKQLLDWHGQPFVRAVAHTALESGLSEVVIVIGAHAEKIRSVIEDLPVKIVHNSDWMAGQSTSIRAGLGYLLDEPTSRTISESKTGSKGPGAVIFLLADQPQIPSNVIRGLVEVHSWELAFIVAPLVKDERRTNPVLFDRDTFPDLLSLQGDIGGRALFSKYSIEYLPWHDNQLLMDVDSPEDYQRLIDSEQAE